MESDVNKDCIIKFNQMDRFNRECENIDNWTYTNPPMLEVKEKHENEIEVQPQEIKVSKPHQRHDVKAENIDALVDCLLMKLGRSTVQRKCDICRIEAPSAQELIPHRFAHTYDRLHTCLICYKTYNSKMSIKLHVAAHSSFKHKCDVCQKQFRLQQSYLDHIMSFHKGYKLYRCYLCEKRFSSQSSLKRHKYLHGDDDEKPFKCGACHKGFTSRYYVNRHNILHRFKCDRCSERCLTKGALNKHICVEKPYAYASTK